MRFSSLYLYRLKYYASLGFELYNSSLIAVNVFSIINLINVVYAGNKFLNGHNLALRNSRLMA